MKLIGSVLITGLLLAAPAMAQDTSSEKGKLSYAIGYQVGKDLVERNIDVDVNTVVRALQDGFGNRNPTVTEDDMREALGKLDERMRTEMMAAFQQLADENQARSQQFLNENRGKTGIVALANGIQYRVIEEGSGRRPSPTSEVTIHYRGSKMDGLEFDSTFARGQPVTFKLDSVIQGWQEVLPLMKIGDYWQVFMPPDMAYGERGMGRVIGPNEALVFDVRLVDVK